jgi:hypothetical protein
MSRKNNPRNKIKINPLPKKKTHFLPELFTVCSLHSTCAKEGA